MKSALLDGANRPTRLLERSELSSGQAETWLQALLFEQPDLVPLDEIDPGAGTMVPLVRELAFPKAGGRVFLDKPTGPALRDIMIPYCIERCLSPLFRCR